MCSIFCLDCPPRHSRVRASMQYVLGIKPMVCLATGDMYMLYKVVSGYSPIWHFGIKLSEPAIIENKCEFGT